MLLSAPASAPWAERFTERYEIHRELNAAERAGRRGRAGRSDGAVKQADPAAAEDRRQFVERARDTTARVDARFKIGFRWLGGYVSGKPGRGGRGYWRSAFRYEGLVSTEHPILRLFVTKLHRARRLLTGNDKGAVTAGAPKVLALDDAYVHANADMRGVIRVELDRDFAGWDQLRDAVLACGVPLPNIVVGHVHEVTGAVQAPHLIWLIENSVCFTGRGRAATQVAFRSALQRLTGALGAAGADEGGRANALKVKNPLSPRWSRAVWAVEPYRSLAAVSAGLPKSEGGTATEVAGQDDAAGAGGSNSLFRRLRTFAFGRVARHHPDGEDQGSRGEYEHEVVGHAYEIADACGASERQAKATAMKVARYAWEHFDGNRWKMKQNWGVCAEQTRGLTEAEAKAVGGRYTAARRREASVEKLAVAYRRLVAEGRELSRATVAEEAGLCTRTAERRWDEVLRAVALPDLEPAVEVSTLAPIDKKVIPADGQENAAGGQAEAVDDGPGMVTGPIQAVTKTSGSGAADLKCGRRGYGVANGDGGRDSDCVLPGLRRVPVVENQLGSLRQRPFETGGVFGPSGSASAGTGRVQSGTAPTRSTARWTRASAMAPGLSRITRSPAPGRP